MFKNFSCPFFFLNIPFKLRRSNSSLNFLHNIVSLAVNECFTFNGFWLKEVLASMDFDHWEIHKTHHEIISNSHSTRSQSLSVFIFQGSVSLKCLIFDNTQAFILHWPNKLLPDMESVNRVGEIKLHWLKCYLHLNRGQNKCF